MTGASLFGIWVIACCLVAWVYAPKPTPEPEPASFPKRTPLPEPSLDELADDMQVIHPQALADIFRRENAHLPH